MRKGKKEEDEENMKNCRNKIMRKKLTVRRDWKRN